MADPTFEFQTMQSFTDAWLTNVKAMHEAWQADSQQQAKQRQSLQDQLNAQHLRFVEDQHTLLMRTADQNANLGHRVASNAASVDTLIANNAVIQSQAAQNTAQLLQALILSGEIDTTAQGAIGAKTAEEFRSAAKQAIEAAIAAVPGTSAPSQGTTGVAQGALQTQAPIELAQVLSNNITIQTAVLTELAQINKALAVLLVRVAGEEVKPPATS